MVLENMFPIIGFQAIQAIVVTCHSLFSNAFCFSFNILCKEFYLGLCVNPVTEAKEKAKPKSIKLPTPRIAITMPPNRKNLQGAK